MRLLAVLVAAAFAAQAPALSQNVITQYVRTAAPVIALTNARVVDGTGAPARANQTIMVRDGMIEELGDSTRVTPPAGAEVLDLEGRTVLPGLVMLHEHLYYPTGPGVYGQLGESFSRLYLAGGVTTLRTGGNMNGYMDINLKRAIERGQKAGPAIDATAPYVNGPNQFQQMTHVTNPEEARRHVAYWADQGATSFKAYMQISRAALEAAIDEAHKRGLKVTGHLCSVTYAEAADLGIDNLEHGFLAATDFVADKKPDECPGQGRGQQTIATLAENGDAFNTLVKKLIDKHVALTSTLTVFETLTPGRPLPPGLDVLIPQLKQQFEATHAKVSKNTGSTYAKLFPKAQALELAFARAGGLLVAGTDPTAAGGVIPGYSNQRQIELLVDGGFTPVEAIRIATLNGAIYLGRDQTIGSIAKGKQADLVVVRGDPSTTIGDIRNVEIVFRRGVGYDPAKLIASVAGRVGLF